MSNIRVLYPIFVVLVSCGFKPPAADPGAELDCYIDVYDSPCGPTEEPKSVLGPKHYSNLTEAGACSSYIDEQRQLYGLKGFVYCWCVVSHGLVASGDGSSTGGPELLTQADEGAGGSNGGVYDAPDECGLCAPKADDEPCGTCGKQTCCDALTKCADSSICGCGVDCINRGNAVDDCTVACGWDDAMQAVYDCATGPCKGYCVTGP